MIHTYKCDVISEKGPYCGRNSVYLDQLFLHFCDIIFYQNCAGSEKNVSFRCSLATNIVGPDQTPRMMRGARRLIRAYDICSAIRSFFVDDVTIVIENSKYFYKQHDAHYSFLLRNGNLTRDIVGYRSYIETNFVMFSMNEL